MALICVLATAGCATTDDDSTPPAVPVDTNQVTTASATRAVCIGLTAVNPDGYDGWDGDCPGCDVDAKGLNQYFLSGGIPTVLILNESCTVEGVKSTITRQAAVLVPGDALYICTSGHGGQVEDISGDESDGMDETVCLWDRQWVDDEILEFLGTLPAGLTVYIITDNCHAEGNFRAMVRTVQRAVSAGRWGRLPVFELDSRPVEDLAVIQLAGCREASYSYGSAIGGTWTQTLLEEQRATWSDWFEAAKAKMPAKQTPTWVEFGPVTPADRTRDVLQK